MYKLSMREFITRRGERERRRGRGKKERENIVRIDDDEDSLIRHGGIMAHTILSPGRIYLQKLSQRKKDAKKCGIKIKFNLITYFNYRNYNKYVCCFCFQ